MREGQAPRGCLVLAGGRQIDLQNGFGCSILVVFEGAGFDFSFP